MKASRRGGPKGRQPLNDQHLHPDPSPTADGPASLPRDAAGLRLLLEELGLPMGLYDPQGRLLIMNRAAARNLRAEPADLVGQRIDEFFPLHGDRYLERLRRCWREQSPATYQDEVPLPTGTFWFSSQYIPLTSQRHGVDGVQIVSVDITHEQEARRDLALSEAHHRAIFEAANDAILLMDGEARIQRANPAAEAIFGFAVRELEGMHISSLLDPADLARRPLALDDLKRNGSICLDRSIVRKDGSRRTVTVSARKMTETLFVCVYHDITAQRLAEEARSRSERRYRQLFDSMIAGFALHEIVLDDEGRPSDYRFLEINPAFEELTGLKAADLVGRTVLEVMPGTEPYWIETYGRVAITGMPIRFEQHSQELGRYYEVQAYCPRTGRFATVFQDVTERRLGEKALKRSRELLAGAERLAGFGAWEWDMAADRWTFSENWLALHGRSRSLESLAELVPMAHPDDRPAIEAALRRSRELGEPFDMEHRILRQDNGEVLHVRSQGMAERDPEGRPIRLFGAMQDITALRRAEADKAMAERQLRQAQKMEALGTLAGGIAHDFNTILAVVTGYTELAQELAAQGRPCADELGQVLDAAGRARDLVRGILAFSRKSETGFQSLDLNRQVRQAAAILRRTLPPMVKIEHHLEEDLAPVRGDAGQMQQVLLNLGANAQDAMPGGGRLTLETRQVRLDDKHCSLHQGAQPGDHALLIVRDTGEGMAPEVLEHIFEPFFTTKEVGSGTGLGLAMVYGIVKSHRGHITCTSAPGGGASFNIYLPLTKPETASRPSADPKAEPPAGEGETVLVVDDEDAVRRVVTRVLGNKGYRVMQASNGEEALATYQEFWGRIDLVLLDLGMPGMGGLACLGKLKKMNPQVKVIIASGYTRREAPDETRAAGAAGFVAKPFLRAELLNKVREVLGG